MIMEPMKVVHGHVPPPPPPQGQENGGGSSIASSGHTNLEELVSLLRSEIPEGRQTLVDTQSNLEKVADYCASAYLDVSC